MSRGVERATFADRQYLRRPGPLAPWVPGLELVLREEIAADVLQAALGRALEAEPRFTVVPVRRGRGTGWAVRGTGPTIDTGSVVGEDAWRTSILDRPFGTRDPSLRVSVRDRRILLAWRHAVSDAAGGVGFGSLVARALDGQALRVEDGDRSRRSVARAIWKESARPGSLVSFFHKVRTFGSTPHRELPTTRPVSASSASRIARLVARQGAGTFTGRVVAEVAAVCAALMPGDTPLTLLLPVNLRPRDRWFPAGNFVGNIELAYASPPDVTTASEDVQRSRDPERYAPWLAGAVREALPGGIGHRGERAGERLERSAIVNNLGRVDPDLFPGCESIVFHGPTAIDFPSVSLVGLGSDTSMCVRVRDHQGGADVADVFLERLVDRLGDVPV